MGHGVATRLLGGGHQVFAFNRSFEKTALLAEKGAVATHSLAELVEKMQAPRVVWLYLPSGEVTDQYITELTSLLQPGDTIIDGGNSNFNDSLRHAAELEKHQLHFVDVGTSGGIAGEQNGYCLMMGGNEELCAGLTSLWEAVAQEDGFARVGPVGAGHYVKMVHNAVEYGMMQAYGEGMQLIEQGPFANQVQLPEVAAVWQRGSIVRSFLGELLESALKEDAHLESVAPKIADSGEGKWAIETALDYQVSIPVMTAALFARYSSRDEKQLSHRVVAILRKGFGGHAITSVK